MIDRDHSAPTTEIALRKSSCNLLEVQSFSFIKMVFFRLNLSILNIFKKMSLEHSYHIRIVLLDSIPASLFLQQVILSEEYTFTNR